MTEAFITTLREALRLPIDIELESIRTNKEYNYVILSIGILGDVVPAVVSFKPLRIDFFAASYGDKLEGLLMVQESAISYNVALSLPLPYTDYKGNEEKIRRIVRYYSKL